MVAIVSGLRSGLNLNSSEVLGLREVRGGTPQARNGQDVVVNVALGQVVVQDQDDLLVARGQDAAVVRTYNSNGSFNDENGDGWTSGVTLLRILGAVNTAGSTIQRVEPDGGAASYDFDATRSAYVSYEGAGALDTITYMAADGQYEWRDGTTGATQRYEGSGAFRLLASRDPSGNALIFAYGANGFLSAVSASNGDAVFYDYVGTNLSQVRTVVGGSTTTRVRYGYDTSNRLISVKVDLSPSDNSIADGKVYQTTYGYDGTSKRIASIAQSDGTSVAFTYVDVGGGTYKVATVREGLNQTTSFTYGSRFTTVTDPLGLVTRYDYDGSAQLTAITGPAVGGTSPTRQFAYDAWGNVVSVTDGEGRAVTYQYDSRGNQVLQRDAAGNTITRTFDVRNQLLSESRYTDPDPDGSGPTLPTGALVSRNVYDATGRNLLRFAISAEGRVTEYRYDGFGQKVAALTHAEAIYPSTATSPDSLFTEAALASWVALQDLGKVQRVDYAYDGSGQLQTRTTYTRTGPSGDGLLDGTQSVESYIHDAAGLLLQTFSAGNAVTGHIYDGLGRTLTTIDAAAHVTLYQYDDAGRKNVITQQSGLVTTSTYDAAGRLVSVMQSNSAATALGETRYFYDADNRLRMTQDPTGVRSWILYDEAGRKTADIDGNGSMTEYVYDRRNLVIYSITRGTAANTSLLVDASGLPVMAMTASSVRPADSANDYAVWRQYDAAGRLVREATSTGTGDTAMVAEMRYDGASRLVQTTRYATVIATTAGTGNVGAGTVVLPAASGQDRVERNFYDGDGRLTGMLDAEGYLTVLAYTPGGQLSERIRYATATSPSLRASGSLAQLTPAISPADIHEITLYDGKGQVVAQVDGEGYVTESEYDADGNVTQTIQYAMRATGAVTASSNLATIRPPLDAGDRRTWRRYDGLRRLVMETSPDLMETRYGYDTAGNLVSTVRALQAIDERSLLARYDLQGRLIAELSAEGAALLTGGQTQQQVNAIWAQFGTSYTYDAASRRTSRTDALGNRTFFFYDADGALTHTVNALGEVQETRYDARGRATDAITYANRIATAGLAGGLVSPALTAAVAAIANAAVDSRMTFTYTRDGRIASQTDAVGTVTTESFNAFGEELARQVTGTGLNRVETYTVDRRGQRTGTIRDAAGVNAITASAYDAFGRLVRSTDANGNVREQVYDRMGRIVSTRDPTNAVRGSTYDAFGRALTQTDAVGNVTRYAYDAMLRSMTMTTAEGIKTRTTYTRYGQVQDVSDGKGQLTSYVYDRNGNLLRTVTPAGSTGNSYDAAGRLTETTDANGTKVAYTYDAANRVLTRRFDPAGLNLTTSYQYDGKGRRISVTDANGMVTTIDYDRKGRVLKQTVDPAGLNLQTTYTYDAADNVLTVRSPAGTVTQYVYDALGRRIQERVDPAGLNLQRSWTYDRNGNAVTSTDARGNVTRYAYDPADRLVFTVDPLGNVQQASYDAEGRILKTTAYANPIAIAGLPAAPGLIQIQSLVVAQPVQDVVEHRVYDRDGRLAATVDGMGAVIRFSYDANGKVVQRTAYANPITMQAWAPGMVPLPIPDAAHDATVRTVYDALDRAIFSVDGIGAVVAQSYDANGNVVQRTEYAATIPVTTPATQAAITAAVGPVANSARDHVERNTYDAAGRLTWTVDGVGAVTQRIYDRNGNVVREQAYATAVPAGAAASSVIATSADRVTTLAYDAANRQVLQVDALRGVTEQAFDADGRVVRRTSYANAIAAVPAPGAPNVAAAIRSALTLDAANDRTTRYAFDAAGRQVLEVDAVGAVTETQFDGAGNVTAVIGYGKSINTSALGDGASASAVKALLQADVATDRVSRSAYDAAGRRVYSVDALGAVQASQYDGVGRLVRTTRYATPIAASTPNTAAGISGALRADAAKDQVTTFSYNAASLLVSTTDALNATESTTYDALGRKLSFTNKKGFTWTYDHDAVGHLLTETAPAAQFTSVVLGSDGALTAGAPVAALVVTRMAYDALGNLTQRTEAAGRPEERTTRYEYDALGRQVRVLYPSVGVYNASADTVTTNGAVGIASRVDVQVSLETQTFYDTLGNAVANRDVGGAISQKAYDALGRVAYEVDALGYVTGYARTAFGDVTSLVRYGGATPLAGASITQATQAAGKAQVEAALAATGFDHSRDRTLLSTYDRKGRLLEKTEPLGFVYDPTASGPAQTGTAGRKTRNTYDAFGRLVQVKILRNAATDAWATTTHYFDRGGQEIATIDALGYLTAREFDAMGNQTKNIEFAGAVAPGWSTSAFVLPAAGQDDRVTTYAYDKLNRKTSETRLGVEFSAASDGTSTRGNLTTSYGYDAVGNQAWVTDADNKTTYTYYDALGRITAVAAPARTSTAGGNVLTPLTVYQRDAYGNVVVKTEFANGATSVGPADYRAAAADAGDRGTLSRYDSTGHVTEVRDANGSMAYLSYDAYGHVAKQWRGVTGNDGVTRTQFEVSLYDKLGQRVEVRAPASTSVFQEGVGIGIVSQAQAGLVVTSTEYNAFGEITRRGSQGGWQEYSDYDNAGRLWRTNAGDGVDRINLYDAQGNVTSEIRRSGSGRDNVDIKTFASAQAAADNPYTRRTDTQYDLLGRVTAKAEAARQELQGGVAVQRQFTTVGIVRSADRLNHTNRVALTWNSLSALGGGDVQVYLEYRTPIVTTAGESGESSATTGSTSGGTPRSVWSGILTGDACASGATVEWNDGASDADAGIGSVTRILVRKKDRVGLWVTVIDQTPGYGTNEITVAAPPDPNARVDLQMRAAGSAGDSGWWTAGLDAFASGQRFNAAGLAPGSYEYRVTVTSADHIARVTATGSVAITMPPLNNIAVQLQYRQGFVVDGIVTWPAPGSGFSQVFRYRAGGSAGGWTELPVIAPATNLSGVDTRGVPAGTYEFELLWTVRGQNVPSAHATGSFWVVAAVPSYYVPAANLPAINGVAIGTALYGATVIGWSESGPAYSGGTVVPALIWPAANVTVAQYRVSGGAWTNLTLDNSAQTIGESGPSGVQKAFLNGIPPGTYEVRLLAGSPATAQATATLTIYPQGPGHNETVSVQVPVSSPVIAYYAPVYETRYAQRVASRTLWVMDITGYDESGTPIFTYRVVTEYYLEWYSYQVYVGQTPVYATDESGNILYQVTYVTQQQQRWVPGTTPAPTLSITTPPYTPAHWAPAVPTAYGMVLTTVAGSSAISTTAGSAIGQSTGMNDYARWLRPIVQQKTDRWGNVVEITDPRASYWKTTYRYNANNQIVQQVLPDAGRGAAATSIYYDALGRQVAVRDANGYVNGQVFDAGGNLVRELHADTGVVNHAYNAFGERVQTVSAEHRTTGFTYDKMGHLLRQDKGIALVFRAAGMAAQLVDTRMISDSWTYDQAGRKLSQANGNGEVIRYAYDLSGNLVATTQPLGQAVRAAYDAQGRKIAEVDGNNSASSWTYNYFGQVTGHVDLAGIHYTYSYDNARQLTAQTSERGQAITYGYDAAGQVTSIRDWANDKTTTYAYDLAGRRLRERVVQGGITYQDNNMAYDARGNLRDVTDGRAHIVLEYDQVGNRTHVSTLVDYQGVFGEAGAGAERYFLYDAMNRQVRVDAVNASGDVGTQGHEITYDRDGNRIRDTSWGSKVVTSGGEQVLTGYGEDGSAIYSNVPVTYTATTGRSTEEYRYDNLNRLVSVVRDGTQIDVRHYDGADRVIQSGPGGTLPTKYAEIINQGLAPDQMNGKETRINRYDANGRLMHQTVLKSDNTRKLDISWDTDEVVSTFGASFRPDGYDAAGNVRGYTITNYEAGFANEYMTDLKAFEGYQASVTRGQSTKQQPGVVTQQYDANGFLVKIADATQPANDRTFVNDATGKALYVSQAGNAQRQLIVNGEVLGQYGVRVNPTDPATGYNNAPNFSNVADFNFGYARVSANYPSASPGAYTVRSGDTLQSIAQSAYGDSSLWYRIAEANALGSNRDLRVGQTLNIPNRVTTSSNNNTTFKPYDPSEIEGDKSPNLATPEPRKKKRNWFAQLVTVVLAVAVAYFTGYFYLAAYGTPVTTATGAVVTTASGATVYTSTSLVAAGAIGGAAGSVVGQGVGIATGIQDGFSWKDVALSAIAGGVGMGLGGFEGAGGADFGAGQIGNRILQSALGNALTQGIGVATGLQQRFDWRGVAASGVGAATGQIVAGPLSQLGDFAGRLATGVVAGAAAAAIKGGRIIVQQVAVDAFGNALGESFQETASESAHGLMNAVAATKRSLAQIDDLQPSKFGQTDQALEEPTTGSVTVDSPLLRKLAAFASMSTGPVITSTAQAGGHYYLIGLVGRALGLEDERLARIMAYSQFPDQVSAADGYTNGVRYKMTGADYAPGAAGLEMMTVVHALNGRSLEDNLRMYLRIIAQHANDDAVVGVALHGLVDSIFHSHYAAGKGVVSYSAPIGHGLEGSDPDYISPDKARLAAGAVIEGLQTVSERQLTADQRKAAMNYVDGAIDRAHALTQIEEIRGGGQVVGRGVREELNFRAISAELLGATGSLPVFPPNDIQSPIVARAITRELTIAQTREFLGSVSGASVSSGVATKFAEAGMLAIERVVNSYYGMLGQGTHTETFRAASLYDTMAWSLRAPVEPSLARPRSGIRY